jgi:lipopolysaccharide/colanic/teichoic acid biosynthesis glycosyltransferase
MKRIFDLTTSITALVVLCPLLVVTYILIYIFLGHPVFFIQERPGLNGKIFRLIKFRSMKKATDKNGNKISPVLRQTKLGRFLRSSSIDELPELINVIKGEMSIVGPRPLRVEYLGHYSEAQSHRHDVRPGITGWAQINGRNRISWEEKFELDIWYTKNRNMYLDIKIIILTIMKVIKREGVNKLDSQPMEPFGGVELND